VYQKYFKRPLDFIMALFGLIVLSPLMLVIAILVRIKLGSPVIFKQPRPGLNEKIFTLYKFRTMTDERNEKGELLPDEVRLTPFGKWLRSTSLDELPELWNILKGDMSFVGPRPQLIKDMVFMTPEQRKRHSIRPGLTGLAQVSGRNEISWDEKLTLDLTYIKRISFLGDVAIIMKTIIKVIEREGVAATGMATCDDLGDYLLKSGRIDNETYLHCIDLAKSLEVRI
jgi:undecaprenyl phosphate N,N'-diacetylbacillosamine 1-phosphate transferase